MNSVNFLANFPAEVLCSVEFFKLEEREKASDENILVPKTWRQSITHPQAWFIWHFPLKSQIEPSETWRLAKSEAMFRLTMDFPKVGPSLPHIPFGSLTITLYARLPCCHKTCPSNATQKQLVHSCLPQDRRTFEISTRIRSGESRRYGQPQ